MVLEDALSKSGQQLFKELLRYYPVAEYEDYLRNGQWKDQQMRIDLQLYYAHREEAGADDPIDLEKVKMPDIPAAQAPRIVQAGALTITQKPVAAGIAQKPVTPVLSTAATDLRELAMFVSKYKLEPQKAKSLLTPLASNRRKYVLTKFKSSKTGPEASAELEAFLAECEQGTDWDKPQQPTALPTGTPTSRPAISLSAKPAISPAKAASATGAVRPVVSMRPQVALGKPTVRPAVASPAKRPLITPATGVLDASKRPRLTVGGGVAPATASSWPSTSLRAAPGAVRPAMRPTIPVIRPPTARPGKGW